MDGAEIASGSVLLSFGVGFMAFRFIALFALDKIVFFLSNKF